MGSGAEALHFDVLPNLAYGVRIVGEPVMHLALGREIYDQCGADHVSVVVEQGAAFDHFSLRSQDSNTLQMSSSRCQSALGRLTVGPIVGDHKKLHNNPPFFKAMSRAPGDSAHRS